MLKFLASFLKRKTPEKAATADPAPPAPGLAEEHAPIYQGLAMTDELREALFPKTPRMVSAIFERPLPPLVRPPSAPAPPPDADSFPFIF